MEKSFEEKFGWLVVATVILGTFLGSIDRTIVNLALPDIIKTFNISVATAGWAITAYILGNAIFVPIWGKLGDTIGRKKVYVAGVSIFVVGSVLCAISWNFSSLVVFRVIQAVAASADYPTAMAILTITFKDGKKRAQALGIWSASLASGAVFGPLIGGPLIDIFGWRSVFFINLPLGLIAILMALAFVKESKSEVKKHRFDVFGAITLGIALSAIVLVLDKGTTWGWFSDSSLLCYLAGIGFFIAFYFIEQNHSEPIVNLKFFKNKIFTLTLANTFFVTIGLMGSMFLVPVFAQTFLGFSATTSGYLFIPMAITLMVAATLGGKLTGKIKAGNVIGFGTFIAAGAMFLFYLLLDPRSGALDIIIPLCIMAFGLGIGMSYRSGIIASSVPENQIGSASSTFVLSRNIAGAFGVAIFASILSSFTGTKILQIARHTIINSASSLVHGEVASLIVLKAQVASYGEVFLIAGFVLIVAGFIGFFIRPKGDLGSEEKIEEELI